MVNNKSGQRSRTLIGVVIATAGADEALAQMNQVSQETDLVELRLDLMGEFDLRRLLSNRPCPVVVTNRAQREGGRWQGSEEERVATLQEAIALGAEYVDIEFDAVGAIKERGRTKLIYSTHDFHKMPADPAAIYQQMSAAGADVAKVTGMASALADNLPVLDFFAQASIDCIGIAMGELGIVSRLLGAKFPSALLTYATLDSDRPVAPGQLSLPDLRDQYRFHQRTTNTICVGVLGSGEELYSTCRTLNQLAASAGDLMFVPMPTNQIKTILLTEFASRGLSGFVVCKSLSEQAAVEVGRQREVDKHPDQIDVIWPGGDALRGYWAGSASDQVRLSVEVASVTSTTP